MRDFRTIKAWEKSHQLVIDVYTLTNQFPVEEKYGLVSQLRRATVSIPTNIAEGCGRSGHAELARFLQISMGSASELEYLIFLAHDLGLINKSEFNLITKQTIEVKRMLASFIKRLRTS